MGFAPRELCLVARLQVHPELRRGVEIAGEPLRDVGCDVAPLEHDIVDLRRRHLQRVRQRVCRQIQRREEFTTLVLKHRARLKEIYALDLSDAEKRLAKMRVFEELRSNYASLKVKWNGYAAFDNWFKQDLNNAHLAAIGLYSQHVATFQKLLAQQNGDFAAFYRAAKEISQLPTAERETALRMVFFDN